MPDQSQVFLPKLRQQRLPGIDLGEDFIYASYDGQSILNLPSSICQFLDIPGMGAGPLSSEIIAPLGQDYQRVIMVLMDALSLHRLQKWMADGTAPVWNRLVENGLLAPLTSITPSTTSAALTTLWTGRSAAEHGIVGYEMWLKEYGIVANTILHAPMTFENDAGSLEKAGFSPAGFLTHPTLGPHLASHGVQAYAFQHRSIIHSGLSEMFFKDVSPMAFASSADLFVNLRQLLANHPTERQYIYIYWSEVDGLAHRYGPDDERTAAEFASFSAALDRIFLSRLSPSERRDTLLILTADHGQITTRPDPHYDLTNHPNLLRRLHILPSGENRIAYLFIKPGQTEAVREYLARTWPNQFSVIESAYAVEAGLFGPGTPHPRLLDRLGDFIVIAHGNAYFWWAAKENHLVGRHGGLHPEEMLVPFLAAPL